jgi:hypothetical protein
MQNNIINEIYQIFFILSILFTIYIIGAFMIKASILIFRKIETSYELSKSEKIILWISLTVILSYIF